MWHKAGNRKTMVEEFINKAWEKAVKTIRTKVNAAYLKMIKW